MMMSDLIERLKRQHERVRDPYAIKKESSIFSEAIALIEQQQTRDAEVLRKVFLDGFYSSGEGFNGEYVGDKDVLDKLANEYINQLRGNGL